MKDDYINVDVKKRVVTPHRNGVVGVGKAEPRRGDELRMHGVCHVNEVQAAIIEPTGEVSRLLEEP